MSKDAKYITPLQKLLERITQAHIELGQLAMTHKIHPDHVSYAQDMLRSRSRETIKALEYEHPDVSVSLPALGGDKPEKPNGSKPASAQKPAEAKPGETKSGEAKPGETQPAESRPNLSQSHLGQPR